MSLLLEDVPDKEFLKPEGLTQVKICSSTGTLPCEDCPGKWEYFLPGTEPKVYCVPKKKEEEKKEEQEKTADGQTQSPRPSNLRIINYRRLD